MKKIFLALTVVCAAWIFSSCEGRLDIPRKGVIALESFYQTNEDAESALVSAYYVAGRFLSNTIGTEAGWNECPMVDPFEYSSDDIYSAGENNGDGVEGNQLNAFWLNDNNPIVSGSYHCYYMIINAANQVIDHFYGEDGSLADTQVKKRCVAEARVLRAFMHLYLAMGWYNPPIVDHVLDANDRPANSKDQNEVLDFVIRDCELALPDLDERASKNDKDGAVKVTKGFCNAVMGKAYLFKGDYANAKTALKKVIDSNKYDLVPSDRMASLYHYSARGCEESVFELNVKYDPSVGEYFWKVGGNFKNLWGWRTGQMHMPLGEGTELTSDQGWGWVNPSKKFVDALIANDGVESARRKAWIKSYDEVLYEMPYENDSECPTLADKKKDNKRGIHWEAGLYGHVGWFMWKRMWRQEDKAISGDIQYNQVAMRYAEVLLMYAEACAQAGDSDGSGLAALNKVQNRAQSQHVSATLTLADVQNEKWFECWLEGSRFPDLVRWGLAEKELANNGKYLPNFADAFFADGEAEHRGVIIESDADWCTKSHPEMGFNKSKHSYYPIPFDEKKVNPNIHDWNYAE